MMDSARSVSRRFDSALDEPRDGAAPDVAPVAPVENAPACFAERGMMKQAMRRLAGGVVVVTAGYGEDRVGFTATTAVSLSLDPPTMLVCVNRTSSSLRVIRRWRHFCVNVLGSEHQAVAERFSGFDADGRTISGADRYAGAEWVTVRSGAQALVGAQAIIDCGLDEVIDRHSHSILLGAVREVRIDGEASASLVYRLGAFAVLPLPS